MDELDILIRGGRVVHPERGVDEVADVALSGGKIAWIGHGDGSRARRVLDAEGLIVSPGFIDTHIHDEEVDDPDTAEQALLRQGVTTAIAGNCGSGPLGRDILPSRSRPWLNLGYLTGHRCLRQAVGIDDVYRAATAEETKGMVSLLERELESGSFGLSFGLEYAPNTSPDEIRALLEVLEAFPRRWVPVHIRYDGPRCVEAVQEVLDYARETGLRFQLSHLGSMTAFGRLAEVLALVEAARTDGVDVTFDCYPYDAFCTHIGSTVFDPGFEERWGKGFEALEAGSGKYKGRFLDGAIYAEMRRDDPDALIIAHVMNEEEVRLCLSHPRCAIASDTLLKGGQGHPRAAGTFPRALRILRDEGLSWPQALYHATTLPAEMAWLDAGRLEAGAVADIVVFDGERLRDRATFKEELLPPEGIAWVIVNGRVAVEGNRVLPDRAGRLLSREEATEEA